MPNGRNQRSGSNTSASKIDSVIASITENASMKAIRQGLIYIMPIVVVGSFVLMMLNLPFDSVHRFLAALFGDNWRIFGLAIHKGTLRIMSLSALISISYTVSAAHELVKQGHLNPLFVILTALSCYVTFSPGLSTVIDEQATGPTGIFGAIVIALLSANFYLYVYSRLSRRKQVFTYGTDAVLLSAVHNVAPMLCSVMLFSLVRVTSDALGATAYVNQVENAWNALLSGGGGVITVLVFNGVTHAMWFLGIHGTNVMEEFAQDVFVTASEINRASATAGGVPTQIVTKEFLDVFVYLGGAGCTLGLLIALYIAGRNSNVSRLAKYCLLPGLFNINEIVLFGLPVLFNPYYLAPFLLTPVALSLTSYAAFASGLVPLTSTRTVWTTPIFLSGYISTGSVAGGVLQLVNILLAAMIYLPFVRMHNSSVSRNNLLLFERLSSDYNTASYDNPPKLLYRNDELGVLARNLMDELQAAMDDPSLGLRMEYQPKCKSDGRVYGAEALLRWQHPVYGYISPQVILGIGKEAGMSIAIGAWTLEKSFRELGRWQKRGLELVLSVNLSPEQLQGDLELDTRIDGIIRNNKLDPMGMELELTEYAALDPTGHIRSRLEILKDMGIQIAIDDFGMGHSTLLYLRDFYADVVKLDISLIRTLTDNVQSQEIIRAIVTLCDKLQVEVVAEGVEALEQIKILEQLGCRLFQGWYFSKCLPAEEFLEYVGAHGLSQAPRCGV